MENDKLEKCNRKLIKFFLLAAIAAVVTCFIAAIATLIVIIYQ